MSEGLNNRYRDLEQMITADPELLNLQHAHQCYSLAEGTLTQAVSLFIAKYKRPPAHVIVPVDAELDQDECNNLEHTGIQIMAHQKAKMMAYLGPIGDEP